MNRAFGGNLVATNKSCQEIPSQIMDTNNTAELPNVNDKVQQSDASKENTDSVTKEQQRAYLTQIVTTNQSYQDITSQTFVAGNPLMGRLWSQ